MRLLIASVFAAVLVFFWGFVFWGLLPFPDQVFQNWPNQDAVLDDIKSALPGSGVYLIPGNSAAMKSDPQVQERHTEGPIAMLFYHQPGEPPMATEVMIKGFVHMLVSALIMGIIVMASARRTFLGKFMIVFWVGIFVAVWSEATRVIWFYFPLNYCLLYSVYHLVACSLMGVVLASLLRPEAEPEMS